MIIGVTEFQEGGRLHIMSGHNDELKFYVGADKEHTINFSPKSGGYSIDDLIDTINNQLEADGQTDVKAIKYMDKHIALYSDKHVITGLSGNMIKLDGITSVLYDNAKYGTVSKTQGYVYGSKDLTAGITIEKGVNDTLNFTLNNQTDYTINLLASGENSKDYTLEALIKLINEQAKDEGIDIIAEPYGSNLRLRSNHFGDKSRVELDSNSNAYKSLFVGEYETTYGPIINPGAHTSATITGRDSLRERTNIIAGKNDELTLTIDGESKTIKLDAGRYSRDDLIAEINGKLSDQGINAIASLGDVVDGLGSIIIQNNKVGEGSLSISSRSSAFDTLFSRADLRVQHQKGELTWQEGIVGSEKETPAVLTGGIDLDETTVIDKYNDELSFNLSGQSVSITLEHGDYTIEGLLAMLKSKLSEANVPIDLSLKDGKNLVLTSQEKGMDQYFSNVSGSAFQDLFATISYYKPSTSSEGKITAYTITARKDLDLAFKIDENNKEFSFSYYDNNVEYKINITLSEGLSRDQIVEEFNTQIKSQLLSVGLVGEEITMEINNGKIQLKVKDVGSDYRLDNFGGEFI